MTDFLKEVTAEPSTKSGAETQEGGQVGASPADRGALNAGRWQERQDSWGLKAPKGPLKNQLKPACRGVLWPVACIRKSIPLTDTLRENPP